MSTTQTYMEIRKCERLFTLLEMLVVLIIMGIIFSIGVSSWRSATERNALVSATNQVVSDLRKSHGTATNRLVPWRVEFNEGQQSYREGPDGGTLRTRNLGSEGPDTEIGTTVTVRFKPDGSAAVVGGGATTIQLRLARNINEYTSVQLNTATSKVTVVDN